MPELPEQMPAADRVAAALKAPKEAPDGSD